MYCKLKKITKKLSKKPNKTDVSINATFDVKLASIQWEKRPGFDDNWETI